MTSSMCVYILILLKHESECHKAAVWECVYCASVVFACLAPSLRSSVTASWVTLGHIASPIGYFLGENVS